MTQNNTRNSVPVLVKLNACDGCGQCAIICPTQVFEMDELTTQEIGELSFLGRLKVRIKGNLKSHVTSPDACIACGKCMRSCHEHAITVRDFKRNS